jgi:predicted TIM-barrel fold metal-dependent hydrolase
VDLRTEPSVKQGRRVRTSLVDVDVHPILAEGLEILLPYLPKRWKDILVGMPPTPTPSGLGYPFPFGEATLTGDATPPDGGPPGSDPAYMSRDFFDRYGVDIGQLILLETVASTSYFPDPEMAAAMMSAFNDWLIDHWLEDKRMRLAMNVSSADPELAAAEIRRVGKHSQVCSVAINPTLEHHFGSRYFYPVFDAAVDLGLPIMTHGGGPVVMAAETYVESRVNVALGGWLNVNNLVMQGTFERYPTLKVMFVECGFSWIVPLLWRMDAGWRRNRFEIPWVKRWPSEYVRDHIRLATQPVDDDPDATELYRQIETEKSYLSEILVYSSDYPHWDNDRPGAVLNKLTEATKEKIFSTNARTTLRL